LSADDLCQLEQLRWRDRPSPSSGAGGCATSRHRSASPGVSSSTLPVAWATGWSVTG